MTTKGVVLFFLFLFGIVAVLGGLAWWNIYGMDNRAGLELAVGVALLLSGTVIWKKWEE